jgi:putative PIN family toxin of toxin-antitoxin system
MKPGGRPPRVALDTNVLFSALARGKGSPPFQILELARRGRIEAVVSPFILQELETVLGTKAGWDERRLAGLRRQLRRFVRLVRPHTRVSVVAKPDADNRILECALDAGADVLVTGDREHLQPLRVFRGVTILSPREYVDRLVGKK